MDNIIEVDGLPSPSYQSVDLLVTNLFGPKTCSTNFDVNTKLGHVNVEVGSVAEDCGTMWLQGPDRHHNCQEKDCMVLRTR